MSQYSKANKKWWNDVTPIHASSKHYDLTSFKKGKTSLQSIEIKELGDVKGKTMLHLMCHFGLDSLSWARKGAIVTGVDISNASIELAKSLSQETNIPAKFICSDVYDLPNVLHKKYDIVYMSYGVLLWLADLPTWAKIVKDFLKPGGTLYIVELHPFTNMLSHEFKLHFDYFNKGPYMDDSSGTYTDWNAKITGATYVWLYSLGDVLNALSSQHFTMQHFHEFPFAMYNQFPGFMKKNKKGQYVLKSSKITIPLLFSLKATI